jgi:hypothetical protein
MSVVRVVRVVCSPCGIQAFKGIRSEEVHPADDRHGKGYQRARFEEVWTRYVPETPPSDPRKRANTDDTRVSDDFPIRAKKPSVRIESDDLTHCRNGLRGCADRNPPGAPTHTRRPFEYRPNVRSSFWPTDETSSEPDYESSWIRYDREYSPSKYMAGLKLEGVTYFTCESGRHAGRH